MTYEDWRKLYEAVSLMLAGAGAAFAFQKLYRSVVGLPPCEPDETDKAILSGIEDLRERMTNINERLAEVEKTAQPSPDK